MRYWIWHTGLHPANDHSRDILTKLSQNVKQSVLEHSVQYVVHFFFENHVPLFAHCYLSIRHPYIAQWKLFVWYIFMLQQRRQVWRRNGHESQTLWIIPSTGLKALQRKRTIHAVTSFYWCSSNFPDVNRPSTVSTFYRDELNFIDTWGPLQCRNASIKYKVVFVSKARFFTSSCLFVLLCGKCKI